MGGAAHRCDPLPLWLVWSRAAGAAELFSGMALCVVQGTTHSQFNFSTKLAMGFLAQSIPVFEILDVSITK